MMAEFTFAMAALYFLMAILALLTPIAMLNTLAIGVIERTCEISIVRAVESTKKQVRQLVVTEVLILAGIGTAFGGLGGCTWEFCSSWHYRQQSQTATLFQLPA